MLVPLLRNTKNIALDINTTTKNKILLRPILALLLIIIIIIFLKTHNIYAFTNYSIQPIAKIL